MFQVETFFIAAWQYAIPSEKTQ